MQHGKFALLWGQLTNAAAMELIWRLTKPHGAKLEANKTLSSGAMSSLSHPETLDFSSGSIEFVFGSDPNGFLGSGSGSVWIFLYD